MRTTAVVIGGGHSGLAVSRRLTERSIDHVVIERGEVANSWRTERWDSLRLLTPNWLTNLPGMPYRGDQPDGYMTAADLATHIGDYAAAIDAPVHSRTTVMHVRAGSCGYDVVTDRGRWQCAAVVIASGACNTARLPPAAASLPPTIAVRTAMDYRSPDHVDEGGVLVVGASATGVQLAEEIHRSGQPVTLAVGEHVRMPTAYRGRDIFWWTDATATLDERYDELDDLVRARGLPSPQLIGSSDHRSIDINHLAGEGITIVGRLGRITGSVAQFSGSLTNTCALADLKMNRLLDRLDTWAQRTDVDVDPPERFGPTHVVRPPLEVDLRRSGISTVLFATGYRPDYSWLDLPVLDRRSRIVHDGGVISGAPGCYVVGLNVLRRRRSSYISGAERDSADIARLLHHDLDIAARSRAGVRHAPALVAEVPVVDLRLPAKLERMEEVRRQEDDELCGFVEHRAGRWHALAVFGAVLGSHDRRDDATHQVLSEGLAALADRWTLRHGESGEEETVCIVEANAAEVTVARGYYSLPGVPTVTITTEQLVGGEWEMHR